MPTTPVFSSASHDLWEDSSSEVESTQLAVTNLTSSTLRSSSQIMNARRVSKLARSAIGPPNCACVFDQLCSPAAPLDLPATFPEEEQQPVDWYAHVHQDPDGAEELVAAEPVVIQETTPKESLVTRIKRRFTRRKRFSSSPAKSVAIVPSKPEELPAKQEETAKKEDTPVKTKVPPIPAFDSATTTAATTTTTYQEMMESAAVSPKTPLSLWLETRRLEKFETPLSLMGVRRLADLAYLTEDDLISMEMDAASRSNFHFSVIA